MEIKHPLQRWCQWLSRTLIILGTSVLFGWYLNINFLKRPIQNLVAMNPVTALCFVLSALSFLLLINVKSKSSYKSLTGNLLALVVLTLSTLKLGSDLLGVDWGLDTWFFHSQLETDLQGNISNRMAPNTAFGFILTGLALLLVNKEVGKKRMPAHYLALVIAFIGFSSIVGYLYQAHAYFGILRYLPMAIHTASGFILIALCILFLHPDKGVMREFQGRLGAIVAKKLIPTALVIPVLFGFLSLYMSWTGAASYEMSLSIVVIVFVVIFLYLIWLNTRELNVIDDQRYEAQQNLKESLKEASDYKYALDAAAIVTIVKHDGTIVYVNDNFCKISKYSKDELIGQDQSITSSGYHDKTFVKNLWDTISSGHIWNGEIKNRAKDGLFYWAYLTIVPLLDKQNQPFEYLSISSDITERKVAEERLQAANKELEAFSYSVAHDLRAPLRSLNGYSQMLKEDYEEKLDDEASRIIGTIQRNATKMGMLIDDLLSFSRLGRKEVQKTKVDMKVLVNDVVKELDRSSNHNAKITLGELPSVKGDYTLLHQVMYNLISNAIKYSSKKENPHVEILWEEKSDGVVFSVTDNGAGFDMSYVDKLFGVFQRLHSQREFEGTGVGLAIVQRIINKHGGKAWAEGKIDEGATFSFMLPKK